MARKTLTSDVVKIGNFRFVMTRAMGFKEIPFSEVKVFPEVNGEAISSVFVRLILWIGKLCHQMFYHVRYPRFIRYE